MTSHNHAYVIDGPEHLHVVLMPHYSASHYTASALMLKRKALSVKEIVAVVNALNDGQKNASVCERGRLCGEAKSYPELIKCVDHLEQFIEATESADEGIFKAISVVRQFVKDHRPKLRQTTLKDFFQHKTLMRFHGASVSSASQGHYSEDHVVTIGIDSTSFVKQWQEVDQ
ncbi:NH(3)-dependent NAD(+) synthetase [Trichinella pseudospiralis]